MNVRIRDMEPEDMERGFLEALEALAPVELDREQAANLARRRLCSLYGGYWPMILTYVAEAPEGRIVGTASLLIEKKFIHRGGLVGHIEDVAVHPDWQRQGIGKKLVSRCVEVAKDFGCYKVILNCKESNVPFYAGLGFRPREAGMRLDLDPGGESAEKLSHDAERRNVR